MFGRRELWKNQRYASHVCHQINADRREWLLLFPKLQNRSVRVRVHSSIELAKVVCQVHTGFKHRQRSASYNRCKMLRHGSGLERYDWNDAVDAGSSGYGAHRRHEWSVASCQHLPACFEQQINLLAAPQTCQQLQCVRL
jgi:hypothetical protein